MEDYRSLLQFSQISSRHTFRPSTSRMPTTCLFCSYPLLGLLTTRLRCTRCLYCAHATCANLNQDSECTSTTKEKNGHILVWSLFLPRWCSSCNSFIWGFTQQGLYCNLCQIAVHSTCVNRLLPCTGKAPSESKMVGTTGRGKRGDEGREMGLMSLPDELFMFLMMFLSAVDLRRVAVVNKRFLCVFLTFLRQTQI